MSSALQVLVSHCCGQPVHEPAELHLLATDLLPAAGFATREEPGVCRRAVLTDDDVLDPANIVASEQFEQPVVLSPRIGPDLDHRLRIDAAAVDCLARWIDSLGAADLGALVDGLEASCRLFLCFAAMEATEAAHEGPAVNLHAFASGMDGSSFDLVQNLRPCLERSVYPPLTD